MSAVDYLEVIMWMVIVLAACAFLSVIVDFMRCCTGKTTHWWERLSEDEHSPEHVRAAIQWTDTDTELEGVTWSQKRAQLETAYIEANNLLARHLERSPFLYKK